MPLTERENYIRNARFQGPQWLPCAVHINNASWDQLRGELEDVLARHPTLFPGFVPGRRDFDNFDFGPAYRAGEDFTDAWDCTWRAAINGLEGVVVHAPLSDWANLDGFEAPDAAVQWDREPADWARAAREIAAAKAAGRVASGGVPHGFLFLRLTYLRGFENAMLDMASGDPRLDRLIEKVMVYNRYLVDHYLRLGVDVIEFADDLGTQTASVVGPRFFHRYLFPNYRSLIDSAHAHEALIAFHSDGYIMDIMDEMLGAGVDIVNPQDLVNGIANLEREVKGRACIRLDIDRQSIVPFGKPKEIRELIEEEVRTLGSAAGGLELLVGIYPPTPAENVEAICVAMEDMRTYWWDGRG